MQKVKVSVLKTVRIADGDPIYGREIIAGTIDEIPADIAESLAAVGYIEEAPEEDADDDGQAVPLAAMTAAQLKTFAAANGIDLGAAKTKADVLAAIEAAPVTTGQAPADGNTPVVTAPAV